MRNIPLIRTEHFLFSRPLKRGIIRLGFVFNIFQIPPKFQILDLWTQLFHSQTVSHSNFEKNWFSKTHTLKMS